MVKGTLGPKKVNVGLPGPGTAAQGQNLQNQPSPLRQQQPSSLSQLQAGNQGQGVPEKNILNSTGKIENMANSGIKNEQNILNTSQNVPSTTFQPQPNQTPISNIVVPSTSPQ